MWVSNSRVRSTIPSSTYCFFSGACLRIHCAALFSACHAYRISFDWALNQANIIVHLLIIISARHSQYIPLFGVRHSVFFFWFICSVVAEWSRNPVGHDDRPMRRHWVTASEWKKTSGIYPDIMRQYTMQFILLILEIKSSFDIDAFLFSDIVPLTIHVSSWFTRNIIKHIQYSFLYSLLLFSLLA